MSDSNSNKLPIETENPLFGLYLYPIAKELMEKQQDIAWFAQEIKVENDKHDFMHNMQPEARDATDITLQTFVEIEQEVGDVWEEISKWFPHSEIDGCCTQIAAMEKSVHAFFYQKMSDVLNIDPETIAKNQSEVLVLKNKLEFLKRVTSNLSADKPLSLATVALIEQVLLFSNFGFLKSFKANGYSLIQNTLTGVDYVINDEVLHGVFASYLHNTYIEESIEAYGSFNSEIHYDNVVQVMLEVIHHEDSIIDYMFKDTDRINDITAEQLKIFIRSRVNMVFADLGFKEYFEIDSNPIAEWFYQGANSLKLHDFFVAGTNQYSRSWSLDAFSRKPYLKGDNNE